MVPETFDWDASALVLFGFPSSHCQVASLPLSSTHQGVRRDSSVVSSNISLIATFRVAR